MVIGNGVVGLSIAIEAVRRFPAARISLIGPDSRPHAATPASAAMLTAISEIMPGTDHGPESAWFRLVRNSVTTWPSWLDDVTAAAGLPQGSVPAITRGLMVIGEEKDEAFDEIERAARRIDAPHRRIEHRETPAFDIRTPGPDQRLLLLEDEGSIDPRTLLVHLDAVASRLGVTSIDSAILELEPGLLRFTDHTTMTAGRIVLACGAGCERLLPDRAELTSLVPGIRFGIGVGLRCRVRTGLRFPRIPVRKPNHAQGSGTYCIPHGPTDFYIGATTEVAADRRFEAHQHEIETLRSRARELLGSDLEGEEFKPVIGHRPVSTDGFPVLGPIGEGLFIASGTNRDGISAAPGIAGLITRAIDGEVESIPDRMRASVRRGVGRPDPIC